MLDSEQSSALRKSYSCDASGIFQEPESVVFAESKKDIIELVKLAIDQNKNIVPRGAGTGLAGGAVPVADSIVLDLSRMNKISNLDIEGKTVEAGPGAVLDDLNDYLANYNLELPVKPGSRKAATIGGMCATNAAGMRAIKYGNMINWVESVEIVDGEGKIRKISGKDLKDIIGREGTTGIIANIKLKVKSLKLKEISNFKFPVSPSQGGQISNKYPISNIQYLISSKLSAGFVLCVEYLCGHSARLLGLKESCVLVESDEAIEGAEEIEYDIWGKRDNLWPLLAQEGFYRIEDPWIPRENISEFLEWLADRQIPTFGHLGVGILHPCFTDGQEGLIRQMYRIVVKLSGKVSGEHGIGLRKREFADSKFRNEILELKKKYDPRGILNKGKII